MVVWTKFLQIAYALLPMSTLTTLFNSILLNHFSYKNYLLSCFRYFENQLLDHVHDIKFCKDNCIKNIIIGGNVSDQGKLGYLKCNRIQMYPPSSAIQDTMVTISTLQGSSQHARCRYIATVKAFTKMKVEEDMKRGDNISGTILTEATQHYPK